jgi:lipopolysaccharide transport system ATP-binding protein
MSNTVISVNNLSKHYLVGHRFAAAGRYGSLRDVMTREARNFVRKATDFVQGRQIVQGDEVEEFWALKDVNFEVKQGEIVGIIGRNGAGKSTLLKILSRITEPTKGLVRIRGRIASLLEVGTGFHGELTGRENIFLNGAILGMTKREIRNKFDEIVAFAEVDRFLDTPVKHYSSGMYVRLAFSVAAHLEPEILLIDEVLAVGDVAFQKKCLSKMEEVSSGGRTILFVSHNLQTIRNFCHRGILLNLGEILLDGRVEDSISCYLRSIPNKLVVGSTGLGNRLNRTTGDLRFTEVHCTNDQGEIEWQVQQGGTVTLRFGYEAVHSVPNLMIVVQLRSATSDELLTVIHEVVSNTPIDRGERGNIEIIFPEIPLRPNEISFYVALGQIDARIFYDVIDKNVDLPFLRVTGQSDNLYDSMGTVSVPYRISTRTRTSDTTPQKISSTTDLGRS